MKRLLVFLIAVSVMASFTSCEQKECKTNNTGEVVITNNTEADLWFDVTDDSGLTNENRFVKAGASTTYILTPGALKVWGSYKNVDARFVKLDEQTLEQCKTLDFQTYDSACEELLSTDLKVVNNYDYDMIVDFWVQCGEYTDGFYLGEITLPANSYYTYNYVPTGLIYWAWTKRLSGGDWYESDNTFTPTSVCSTFTWTWSPTKDNNLVKKVDKMSNTVNKR